MGKRRKAALHGGSERLMSERLEWAKYEADGALVRPRRQGTVPVDRDLRRIERKTGNATNCLPALKGVSSWVLGDSRQQSSGNALRYPRNNGTDVGQMRATGLVM